MTLAKEVIEASKGLRSENNIKLKMTQLKETVFGNEKILGVSCYGKVAKYIKNNLADLPENTIIRFFGISEDFLFHVALMDSKTKKYLVGEPTEHHLKASNTYDYTVKQLKDWK